MSVILFILGILVTGAGLLAIAFGIPINEFNLGNTLIVSGTVAFSAGLILIGLSAAVDQLAQIAKTLRGRPAARPTAQPPLADQPMPVAVRPAPLPAQAPAPPPAAGPIPPPVSAPAKPAMPAPPRGPVFARGEAPAPEASPEVSSSAIERLRSSLARPKGVEPGEADEPTHAPTHAPAPPPSAAAPAAGANGSAHPGSADAALKKKPPLDFLFRSKARDTHAEPFDAVWPKRGGRPTEDPGEPTRAAASEAATRPGGEMAGGEDGRATAILKSGVVDGMAYTLYVDGSIEAQLPQGTVRFGSIAELRSHIENNS